MLQQFYPGMDHKWRYELNKDMNFSAAHYVPHEDAGQCMQMHGHTYFVNVTIVGNKLNPAGFLVDFKRLKDLIHGRLDHKVLNNLELFGDSDASEFPTTEIVARVLWKRVQDYLDQQDNKALCIQMMVRETPTSYVVFRPDEKDFGDRDYIQEGID